MTMRALTLASALTMTSLTGALAQTTAPNPAQTVPPASSTPITTPTSPSAAPATANPAPGATTGSIAATPMPSSVMRQLTVNALEDMDLVDADGRKIADVEGVVENSSDKKQFVVIERGGFLGFGAKAVAIPMENVAVLGDKVTLRNMDMAQLDGTANYKNENGAFRELDDAQQVSLALRQ